MEVQITLPEFIEVKKVSHVVYELARRPVLTSDPIAWMQTPFSKKAEVSGPVTIHGAAVRECFASVLMMHVLASESGGVQRCHLGLHGTVPCTVALLSLRVQVWRMSYELFLLVVVHLVDMRVTFGHAVVCPCKGLDVPRSSSMV